LDLPEGAHSIVIPMRDLDDPSLIEVTGPPGLSIGAPVPLDRIAIAEGSLDSAAEAEARAEVDAAEDAVQDARDALARRDAEIGGLEAQLAYLTALSRGGPEGAEMPSDPAALPDILASLGRETARIGTELQAVREARRTDEEILEDRLGDLQAAEIALDALEPFGTEVPGIRIDVEAAAAVSGAVEITYITQDA
jgi:hypothetical protein